MSAATLWEWRRDTPGYPDCLSVSPQPPDTLYGIGRADTVRPGLAIVGSRRATPYGLACARVFAMWAAQTGIVVVSGAAAGCDQAAQRAAVAAGGASVAVLGCGADVDYPASASDLLAALRQDGAVVSELPWGTHPARHAFVRRNRLIAALSGAVLVVEAGLPSGTFTTADFALAAGRDVLAVPGSVFADGSRGTNRLIRQGATPITDVSELAEALGPCGAGLLDRTRLEPRSGTLARSNVADEPLVRALLADPMRPDDVARALGRDVVSIVREIGDLESKGIIARYPDGRYGPA